MRSQDVDNSTVTNPEEPREFSSVISRLQKSYPKEKMEEISTSFCFICLLHLANEQGLRLQTLEAAPEDEDMTSEDKDTVGNIWSLKVRPLLPSLAYNATFASAGFQGPRCHSCCLIVTLSLSITVDVFIHPGFLSSVNPTINIGFGI